VHLFLSDNTTTPYVTLLPDDSRHCVRVLRMAVGDELWVTSGDGTMCRARITDPDDKGCEVEIIERIEGYQPRPFHLHVAVAPTKNNARLEWFVEKAVEIGIDRITPIICDHSERPSLKTDRLDKLALSAMKQSLRALRPVIDMPVKLVDFLHQLGDADPSVQRFVCYCSGDDRHTLRQLYTPGSNALVLIGPEGDFSDREITTALQQGFQPVTLGDSRLRTETAALYATTVLNFMN
jgi:16S rRNA (uracil1498-N3)-methyltransferase